MVKWWVVDSNRSQAAERPIGVVASLITGFDRVASRPVLILPPLALDVFLWLGPRVSIAPLVRRLLDGLRPLSTEPTGLEDQFETLRQALELAGEQFNLLTALSSLPAGIPSLMAGFNSGAAPIERLLMVQVGNPGVILMVWLLLTTVGLGLGAFYHRGLASAASPEADLPSGLWAWSRLILLAMLLYGGLLVASAIAFLVATVASFILPLLGIGVSFVAFSLIFWLLVYLVFTPHGIVRYRFGVLRAMVESALVVRWNFLGTVGFLAAVILISWLTNLVWTLAESGSWFTGLSILGHAFISGMLLTSSYAYYQGRRDWLEKAREKVEARLETIERRRRFEPPDAEEGDA